MIVLGTGLLAQTIAARAAARSIPVRLVGHDEIELTSEPSVGPICHGEVVINTAAYHRMKECEDQPNRAYAVNSCGPRFVAMHAAYQLFVSTDYVFNDGGPHDPVLPGHTPRSVYGRTKLAGELAALERGGGVVRVSGLFGHYPSHKGPTFPESVRASYSLGKYPDDQRFSPTYAEDAADAILCIAADQMPGIFHANNSGSTTWAEFAQHICEVTRHPRAITPYHARDPLRPVNSSLRSTLRHWRFALAEWAWQDARRNVGALA